MKSLYDFDRQFRFFNIGQMSFHKSNKKLKSDDNNKLQSSARTCSTCHRDITSEVYIKCSKCSGYDQCLECFSVGNESKYHERSHPFLIMEPIQDPIYRKGWSAEEEVLLLHAIQVCGFGNWHEVSDVVKTKSPLECQCHYFGTYMDSPIAPHPLNEILPEVVLPPPPNYDTTPTDSRPSIAHEKNLADRNKKDRTTPAEFAGWMPKRNEFEVEYQNEAEQLIANISFFESEENASSLDTKLQFLRVYNEILEERHKRTEFALEWDLLEHDFKGFGGKTKIEKEIEESLMPLAQVVPREPLTSFIHSLHKESRLKENIDMLIKWRKNGIVTRDEGILFNNLEALMNEEKLTPSAVEKWNKEAMNYAESPEFRATLDRQLLSVAENQLSHNLGISPHMYLRLKDLLLREFTIRSEMTREIAISFAPSQQKIMVEVYNHLKSLGLFFGSKTEDPPEIELKSKEIEEIKKEDKNKEEEENIENLEEEQNNDENNDEEEEITFIRKKTKSRK